MHKIGLEKAEAMKRTLCLDSFIHDNVNRSG